MNGLRNGSFLERQDERQTQKSISCVNSHKRIVLAADESAQPKDKYLDSI
jgi:hypothetical protein